MKYCLTLCLLLSLLAVNAQDYKVEIYQSYMHEKMDHWRDLMTQMEQDFQNTSDPDLLYDLLEAAYGPVDRTGAG